LFTAKNLFQCSDAGGNKNGIELVKILCHLLIMVLLFWNK